MANETEENVQIVYHDGYSNGLEFTLSVCLCYTLCVLGLRLYIRWKNFAIDDIIISLSTAFAFAFFGCGYASIPVGLGRSTQVQEDDITELNTLTLVSDLSWIIALCLSKLAVIRMLLRTTLITSHRRLQYLVGSLVAAQCIISITIITAHCGPFENFSRDFRLNNHACPRQELRWRIITGCDVATEIAILILPIQLVWKLQMSPKNKFIVIVAFWLRMPNIVFTILRNNATNNLSSTTNVSLTAAMVLIWQAIEMSYSVAAATIAALKRWTESLNTGFGHGELIRVHGSSQNYKLSDQSGSFKSSKSSKPQTRASPGQTLHRERIQSPDYQLQELDLRPRHLFDEIEVASPTNYSRPIVGAAQEVRLDDMSIRQDFRYSVHYDEEPLVPGTQH